MSSKRRKTTTTTSSSSSSAAMAHHHDDATQQPQPHTACLNPHVTNNKTNMYFSQLPLSTIQGDTMKTNVEWCDDENIVYIRPCFVPMLELVRKHVRTSSHAIIRGVRGSGKTLFGHYAAKTLLDEGYVVIYIHLGWDCTHLYLPRDISDTMQRVLAKYLIAIPTIRPAWAGQFTSTSPIALTLQSKNLYDELTAQGEHPDEYLRVRGEHVVVIVDAPARACFGPDIFSLPSCGSLVVASPEVTDLSVLTTFRAREYYFPLWTEAELVKLFAAWLPTGQMLSEDDKELLSGRIGKFGPVPRWVARKLPHEEMIRQSDEQFDRIMAALQSANYLEALDPKSATYELSSMLVHIVPDASFCYLYKRFASRVIGMLVVAGVRRYHPQELPYLLSASSGIKQHSTITKGLYISTWESSLQAGGTFELWELLAKGGRKKKNQVMKRIVQFPPTARRSCVIRSTEMSQLMPKAGEEATFVTFPDPAVGVLDFLLFFPKDVGDAIFGQGSTVEGAIRPYPIVTLDIHSASYKTSNSDVGSPMCVFAGQVVLDTAHALNANDLSRIMDLAAHLSGDPPVCCFHYVIMTHEERANDFTLTQFSSSDPRIDKLRQWVLVMKE